ncbi:MAG: DUF2752 domain-containing protein [Verrucomicrobiota bacterium]|nr:DUF2752 domain-containing protein [Verrucomicrobiota bacterium]
MIAGGIAALHLCGVRVCLFKRLTGLPCLTCGGSRAFAALLAGDVAGALRVQPLLTALGAVCGAGAAVNTALLLVWRRRLSVGVTPAGAAGLALLAALNWAYLVWRGV